MENRLVYNPLGTIFALSLAVLIFFAVSILFLGVVSTAFTRIGFHWQDALALLVISFIGSGINLPLTTLKSEAPVVTDAYVRVFGITYRIPLTKQTRQDTVLAINFGGAVVPTLVSLFLLAQFPSVFLYALIGIVFVTMATNRIAKPVKGLGIVTPALIPPILAALLATILTSFFLLPTGSNFIIAYASGTLGTLIGADILNIPKLKGLGAPVASIGGAGTFDGVFLTGIIAVLLT
jgi:uncharacterized membrane protein